jgi:hypothetical protein
MAAGELDVIAQAEAVVRDAQSGVELEILARIEGTVEIPRLLLHKLRDVAGEHFHGAERPLWLDLADHLVGNPAPLTDPS